MDGMIIKWTLDPQRVPFSIVFQELSFYVNHILAFHFSSTYISIKLFISLPVGTICQVI